MRVAEGLEGGKTECGSSDGFEDASEGVLAEEDGEVERANADLEGDLDQLEDEFLSQSDDNGSLSERMRWNF